MFFGGELRSSVRISHGSENFGFRCSAMPIIIIIISIPKSSICYFERQEFFQRHRFGRFDGRSGFISLGEFFVPLL